MNIYFSETIRRLRKERGMTQEALSDILGVSFQAVSKWERGESYPDIEILPDIADYFGVSVDELLGVNRAENEKEILGIIEKYDNLTDAQSRHEIIANAIEKFPNDFRLKLRHMGDLAFGGSNEECAKNLNPVRAVYANIQNNCTNDGIRICSKRYLASYYRTLSDIENSGVTFDDCEKIIGTMPHMRDGQEFLRSYLFADAEGYKNNIMEAVEEEISLLCHGISHLFDITDENADIDTLIYGRQAQADMLDLFYNDGNYGRAWKNMIFSCGYLGCLYAKKGDCKKAAEYFGKEAELAVRFDSLDRVTVMHSTLFEGREFDKNSLGSDFSAKDRVRHLLEEKYPLPDEFRTSPEYQAVIEM
ncbi:MAG: helix-turn-helix transcriptional regulator [Clostridia bacterium]|nr:helix-turn-helix transcriptional regulator [Clostridia bacterium]